MFKVQIIQKHFNFLNKLFNYILFAENLYFSLAQPKFKQPIKYSAQYPQLNWPRKVSTSQLYVPKPTNRALAEIGTAQPQVLIK